MSYFDLKKVTWFFCLWALLVFLPKVIFAQEKIPTKAITIQIVKLQTSTIQK